jgi:hypothetical protein
MLAAGGAELSSYLKDTVTWVPTPPDNDISARAATQRVLNAGALISLLNDGVGLTLNLAKRSIHTVSEIREWGVTFLGTFIGSVTGHRSCLEDKVRELEHASACC